MTDTKYEALKQALQYHFSMRSPYEKGPATPEKIVETAKKFEKFLDGSKSK